MISLHTHHSLCGQLFTDLNMSISIFTLSCHQIKKIMYSYIYIHIATYMTMYTNRLTDKE